METFLRNYESNPYKGYKTLSEEQKIRAFLRDLEVLIKQPEAEYFSLLPYGFAIVYPLLFDAKVYGFPMGAIKFFYNSDACLAKVKGHLFHVLHSARQQFQHICVKIDVGNRDLLKILIEMGFNLADTIDTYLFERGVTPVVRKRVLFSIRELQPSDGDAVVFTAQEAFLDYNGRYHRDPILHDKAPLLYQSWVESLLSLNPAGRKVLVAERRGNIVGFFGYPFHPSLGGVTGKLHGYHGISGVSRRGKGAYVSFCVMDPFVGPKESTLEYDTSSSNVEVIRVWKALGFSHIRSTAVLHHWEGGATL